MRDFSTREELEFLALQCEVQASGGRRGEDEIFLGNLARSIRSLGDIASNTAESLETDAARRHPRFMIETAAQSLRHIAGLLVLSEAA